MFTGRWLIENSIAQVIKSSIIIRNLAAFYNYNFEIGNRTANGKRQTAKGEGQTGKGERDKRKVNGEWRTAEGKG